MQTFKKLYYILNPYERKLSGLLLVLILIMALLDMIGVASILPFVAILTNQSLIESNLILNNFFETSKNFGLENKQQFILLLGFLVLLLLITSLALKALTTYVQIRFCEMRSYSIGKRLVEGYLRKPYHWFLNKNSSEIGKNILQEVTVVVAVGMGESLQLIAKGSITLTIIFLLILVDPKLAFIVGFILCGIYSLFYILLRKNLTRVGKERFLNNELQLASTSYPDIQDICEVEDSLLIAREKFPGQRNSLDALATRYDVSGYDRTFHGALLDANILADVYMQLTGGQSKFEFITNGTALSNKNIDSKNLIVEKIDNLPKINICKEDIQAHESRVAEIEKKHSVSAIWRKFK